GDEVGDIGRGERAEHGAGVAIYAHERQLEVDAAGGAVVEKRALVFAEPGDDVGAVVVAGAFDEWPGAAAIAERAQGFDAELAAGELRQQRAGERDLVVARAEVLARRAQATAPLGRVAPLHLPLQALVGRGLEAEHDQAV